MTTLRVSVEVPECSGVRMIIANFFGVADLTEIATVANVSFTGWCSSLSSFCIITSYNVYKWVSLSIDVDKI